MILAILASLFAMSTSVTPSAYLYKLVMVRAAPGRLLELIDAYHHAGSSSEAFGEVRPFIMRHSQGDPVGPAADLPSLAHHWRNTMRPSASATALQLTRLYKRKVKPSWRIS